MATVHSSTLLTHRHPALAPSCLSTRRASRSGEHRAAKTSGDDGMFGRKTGAAVVQNARGLAGAGLRQIHKGRVKRESLGDDLLRPSSNGLAWRAKSAASRSACGVAEAIREL